jgi:hypothetical protein
MAGDAGLADVGVTLKRDYIDAMTGWNDPMYRQIMEHFPPGTKPGDFVTSMYVTAKKPF